jgi:hypothetical protein
MGRRKIQMMNILAIGAMENSLNQLGFGLKSVGFDTSDILKLLFKNM